MSARLVHRVRGRLSPTGAPAEAGFTLLEVLVSFVLFVIVSTAATYAIISSTRASHTSQKRIDAANAAQQIIADAQQHTQDGVNGVVTRTVPGKDETFTVKRTITFLGGATRCNPGGSYIVNVEIFQADKTGTDRAIARSDTVVTC